MHRHVHYLVARRVDYRPIGSLLHVADGAKEGWVIVPDVPSRRDEGDANNSQIDHLEYKKAQTCEVFAHQATQHLITS